VIRRTAIVIAALVALLLAGCGGSGSSSDQLASLAPADTPFYLESVVRPDGAQRDAIDSLSSRVGAIDDPGAAIVQQVDFLLSESGTSTTYEDDIAPWLGERAALFVGSFDANPPFAAIFESTDTGATDDFLKKAAEASPDTEQDTYNGVQYYSAGSSESGPVALGVVGDFLVAGTLDGFKAAVDASKGDSLADASAFTQATSSLPDDNLALGYADGQKVADQVTGISDPVQATAIKSALQTFADGPLTFALSATSDTATVDLSLPTRLVAQLDGGDLVGQSPADAWFSVGLQDVGGVLGNVLGAANALQIPAIEDRLKELTGVEPKDALSWMNNGHAFVGGTSEKTISIGGVVGSSDPEASAKAIDAFRNRFQQDADANLGPPPKDADPGFSATAPESPQAIQVGQFGDQVVAALGPGKPGEEALDPKQPLSDDSAFQDGIDAMDGDFSPLTFVRLSPFFVVAEKGGSASDPDYIAAKPYLQKLDYLMVGTSGDGDRSTARFVVGVK